MRDNMFNFFKRVYNFMVLLRLYLVITRPIILLINNFCSWICDCIWKSSIMHLFPNIILFFLLSYRTFSIYRFFYKFCDEIYQRISLSKLAILLCFRTRAFRILACHIAAKIGAPAGETRARAMEKCINRICAPRDRRTIMQNLTRSF